MHRVSVFKVLGTVLIIFVVATLVFEVFVRLAYGGSGILLLKNSIKRSLPSKSSSSPPLFVCNGAHCPLIEDKGKISVEKRPEVVALAEKYGWDHVHILAMDIKLVSDLEFIRELRPDFAQELGCVIVVHAGENDGYVYQENMNLEVVRMETMSEFVASVKDRDPELLFKFFLSLH